jgi:hypothetical protein
LTNASACSTTPSCKVSFFARCTPSWTLWMVPVEDVQMIDVQFFVVQKVRFLYPLLRKICLHNCTASWP